MNEELNKFLRSKKVLQVESQLLSNAQGAFWCFCIKYLDGQDSTTESRRKDYKQELDEASFQRFSRMREIRKQIAQEEAIPAYAIFTDKELASLARIEKELTPARLKSIKGIGQKKVEKYGHFFIEQPVKDEESK